MSATYTPPPLYNDPLAASKAAKNGGYNEHTGELEAVQKLLLTQYQSFDKHTFFSLCRGIDIPVAESAKYFDTFTRELLAAGRLKAQTGAYEWLVFHVV